ncbi:MAG: hypothetical protein O2970_11890 [Proteobacteria bacterium]|nr:hypothetical protein [Pseudomonadota bacterium]
MNKPLRFYELYEYTKESLQNYLVDAHGYDEDDLENFSEKEEIADHIIAQGYTEEALGYLKGLRKGE